MTDSLRTRRRRTLPAAVALLLMLAGCAAPPPDPGQRAEAWAAHRAWLAQIDRWRIAGKLAVDLPADSWSANLRWRERPAGYSIWLGGPFGQGAVNIEGDASSVTLRTAEGRSVQAETPEQLVAAELGTEVPVSRLRHWILGRPAPDEPVAGMTLDGDGRLATLDQSGWQVTYQDYEAAGAGYLPRRLEIRRGDVRARFVLGSWRLGA